MKKFYKPILLSFLFSLVVWIIDAFLDHLFYPPYTFLDLLVFKIPPHELTIRILIIIAFTIFGIVIAFYNANLQRQRNKYFTILNSIGDAVIATDKQGLIQQINSVAAQMTGWKKKEAIQQPIDQVLDLDIDQDNKKINDIIKQVVEEGNPVELSNNVILTAKDNKKYHISDSAAPIIDTNGETVGVVFAFRNVSKEYHLQEEIKENEKRLEKAQEIGRMGYWEFDLETGQVKASQEACRIYGLQQDKDYTIEEVQQIPLVEYRSLLDNAIQDLVQNNIEYNINFKIQRPTDGKILDIHSLAEYDENNNRVVGTLQDITNLKKAQKAFQQSERKYQNLFNSIRDAILVANTDRNIINYNPAFTNLFGYDLNEIKGKQTEIIYKDKNDFHQLGEKIASQMSTGDNFIHTIDYKKKSGEIFPGETNVFYLTDENGEVNGFIGLIRDISQRIESERALQASEKKFRSLVEQAAEMLFLHDTEGQIIDVNRKTVQNTGYSREEILNLSIFDFDPQAQNRNDKINYWKKLTPEDPPPSFETVHQRKDGSQYPAEVTLSKVKLEDGNYILGLAKDITERKQREQEYKELINGMREMVFVIDMEGNILDANDSAVQGLGYSRERLLEMGPKDFDPNLTIEEKQRNLNNYPTEELVFETSVETKSGAEIPVEVSSTQISYRGKKAYLSIARDITERKEAQAKLRSQKQGYQLLVDTLPYGVEKVNLEGEMVFLNKAHHDLLGYQEGELVGRHIWDFEVDQEHKERLQNYFQKIKQDQPVPKPYISQNLRKDGTVIDVMTVWNYIHNNYGDLTGFICVISDITERKEAERELKASREHYKTVFENTGEATIIIEADTTISLVNKEFEKLSGYTKEEVENKKSWKEFASDDDLERMTAYHKARRTETEDAPNQYEFDFIDRAGETHNVLITIDMIPNTDKSIASFLDISDWREAERERERLREQLLQTQKLESIGTLAGGVAHDFNNILTVIIGLSQLILSRTSKADPNYGNLESILNSAERAADLTRQLLLFSRKQEMDFEIININESIASLRKMLDRLISEDITIHNDLSYDIWPIKADTTQIEQVVTNLVVNARDAMPNGGELYLKTQNIAVDEDQARNVEDLTPGRFVRLDVEDTGHGIEADILENIFDPFFTTKGRANGTGMGLSVVHGIIKKHEGAIEVNSTSGAGTTFSIYLPAVFDKSRIENEEVAETFDQYRGNGEQILLVEDEDSFLNYLENALESYGYNLYSANNGERARAIFAQQKEQIDLLLSDVIMPNSNGVRLADELKSQKKDLKIILSSGYTENKVDPAEVKAKGYKFIHKPYGVLKILKLIKATLTEE